MTDLPDSSTPPNAPRDGGRSAAVPPWFVGAAGALLIATFAIVVVLLLRDDGEVIDAVGTTTTGVESTTTTATDSTTTTTEAATTSSTASSATTVDASTTTGEGPATTIPQEYATAVWPWFDSDVRYDEPDAAAAGFAVDYLGFDDPVVGEFQQGDSRSGEVEIRPLDDGPATTVFVRQLGPEGQWWVLGAATANITVETPGALCEVSSPLTVDGVALAFEGNVEVQVRADGVEEALATTSVTGGGSEASPFAGQVTFESPDSGSGAIVFLTRSAKDGGVWEASVVRVSFGSDGC